MCPANAPSVSPRPPPDTRSPAVFSAASKAGPSPLNGRTMQPALVWSASALKGVPIGMTWHTCVQSCLANSRTQRGLPGFDRSRSRSGRKASVFQRWAPLPATHRHRPEARCCRCGPRAWPQGRVIRNAGERRDSRTLGIHVRKDDDRVTIAPSRGRVAPERVRDKLEGRAPGPQAGQGPGRPPCRQRAGRQAKGRGEGSAREGCLARFNGRTTRSG